MNKVDSKYMRSYYDYRDSTARNYVNDTEYFVLGNSQTLNSYIDQSLKITEFVLYPYGIGYVNMFITSYDIVNPFIDQFQMNYLDQMFFKSVTSTMTNKINSTSSMKYYEIFDKYCTHIPTQINLGSLIRMVWSTHRNNTLLDTSVWPNSDSYFQETRGRNTFINYIKKFGGFSDDFLNHKDL